MATWRSYGTGVFVSAGVLISGVLWYGRDSRIVRGEDVAECSAALFERAYIPTLYGTNIALNEERVAALSDSYWDRDLFHVTAAPIMSSSRGGLGGIYDIADRLRYLVWGPFAMTEGHHDYDGIYLHGTPILWLDATVPLPEHGAYVAHAEAFWTNSLEYALDRGQKCLVYTVDVVASNATDSLASLQTLTVIPTNYWYWSDTPYESLSSQWHASIGNGMRGLTNNYPMFDLFAPSFGPAVLVEGPASDWESGNWWTENGLGTNVWRWGHEVLTGDVHGYGITNSYGETNYYDLMHFDANIRTTALDQIRILSGGMTRTISWIPYWQVRCARSVTYLVDEGDPNYVGEGGPGQSPPDYFDAVAWVRNGASVTSVVTNGPGPYYGYVTLQALAESYYNVYSRRAVFGHKPKGEEWTWHWSTYASGDLNCKSTFYEGCSIEYPSEYAYKSNYVAKVTIYAVAEVVPHSHIYVKEYSANSSVTISAYAVHQPAPEDYNGLRFGCSGLDYVCELPSLSVPDATPESLTLYSFNGGEAWTVRLNKLCESVDNPTSETLFDIGSKTGFQALPPLTASWETDTGVVVTPDGSLAQTLEYHREEIGHAMFYTPYIVVIVDWNWKHLNPDNPYVPETHIPAWMQ